MASSLYLPAQALSIFILLISITILGLTINNTIYYNSSKSSTGLLKSNNAVFPLFPENIDVTSGGVWALFATGVGGTVDSLLLLGLFYYHRKRAGLAEGSRWVFPTILFVCFVSVVRSMTAMAYAFAEYNRSPALMISVESNDNDSYTVGVRDSSKVALEQWNESIARYLVNGGRQAGLARQMTAARALSVVVFVAYLIETMFSVLMWRKHSQSRKGSGKRAVVSTA
jgi:hypothetical protein